MFSYKGWAKGPSRVVSGKGYLQAGQGRDSINSRAEQFAYHCYSQQQGSRPFVYNKVSIQDDRQDALIITVSEKINLQMGRKCLI